MSESVRIPGYRFKDGKLMIFSVGRAYLIRGWEKPDAVWKKDGGGWEGFVPEFRLVAPYRRTAAKRKTGKTEKGAAGPGAQLTFDLFDSEAVRQAARPFTTPLPEQRKRAFDAFRFSLPRAVAAALEKFRSHQWNLLLLMARQGSACDLAKSNPVLAYAVADWFAEHPRDPRKAGELPQRELLGLLGVPETAANVRVLRKIPPESLDRRLLPALLGTLRNTDGAGLKLLHHVPRINYGVMRLLLSPEIREGLTPTLLEEVAAEPTEKYRAGTASLLGDILVMKIELADRRPLGPFRSLAKVRECHDEVAGDFQKLERLRTAHGKLPLPPLPGIPGKIIPLCSQSELMAEGRAQHNCVASYTGRVKARELFIYSVLEPERATLAIQRGADTNWAIHEIEASCNTAVRKETRKFVNDWLEPYRLGV
jgi:hypothetical protein